MKDSAKPKYRVPSMAEINAVPLNGLKVASTFAGCGGSCLGYRMAGLEVVWANECDPHAAECWRTNHNGIMDERPVQQVQPEEVLEATGLEVGELDILDGSPPCVSFSTAGARQKYWGVTRRHAGVEQTTEDLFLEYIRLLRGLQPRSFIAENVRGMIIGTAKGWFKIVLAALRESGYQVRVRVLDAQWLGVPQVRRRVIFMGIRNDLGFEPTFPRPLPWRYSVRDACPWIGSLRLRQIDAKPKEISHVPAQAITATATATATRSGYNRKGYRVEGRPDDVIYDTSGFVRNMPIANRPSPTIMVSAVSSHFSVRGPDISGTAIDKEAQAQGMRPGDRSDRYFSLCAVDSNRPSPTIEAVHGGKGTASPIIAEERRKFSILELKRICSFPDDFILTGTYAQQWARMGNSVPPLMMAAVARSLRDSLLGVEEED